MNVLVDVISTGISKSINSEPSARVPKEIRASKNKLHACS